MSKELEMLNEAGSYGMILGEDYGNKMTSHKTGIYSEDEDKKGEKENEK